MFKSPHLEESHYGHDYMTEELSHMQNATENTITTPVTDDQL